MKHTIIPLLWFGCLAIILTLGLFMPLQTDEIAEGYLNDRAVTDRMQTITLTPQCTLAKNFAKPLPLSWYPFAWVNHVLFMHSESLRWIRIAAMIRLILLLIAWWYAMRPLAKYIPATSSQIFLVFSALLGLDSLPLLLQEARPEQSLLLGISILIALAVNAPALAQNSFRKITGFALFILTLLIMVPVHPKAIFIAPLACTCAGILTLNLTGNKRITTLIIVCIFCFFVQSTVYQFLRYACPENAIMHDLFSYEFHPAQLIQKPLLMFSLFASVFSNAVLSDFSLYFQPTILHGGWIPLFIAPSPPWVKTLQYVLGSAGLRLRAFVFFYAAIMTAMRFRNNWRQTIKTPYPLLGNLLLLTVISLLLVVYDAERAFYLATLELPLLCLGVIFLSASIDYFFYLKPVRYALIVMIVLSGMNCLFLAYKYSDYVNYPVREIPIHGKRDILVSQFDLKANGNAIRKAYAACALPPLNSASHLILDDFTYPALKSTSQPFNISYVTGTFHYGVEKFSIRDLFDVMDRYHSDGIFVVCDQVPDSLMPFVSKHGNYCCMRYPVK